MSSDHTAFIPSALDDMGLRAGPFRVFCHLCRRAGITGRAWPSAQSIAAVCRMDPDTVWKHLGELELKGMIQRESRAGTSSVFIVMPESAWITSKPTRKNGVPREIGLPEKSGHHPPESTGYPAPEKSGQHPPGKTGCEGSTMEGAKRRVSTEVEADILAIYDAYPRKEGRKVAIESIRKAIKGGSLADHLLERTRLYAAATATWNEHDRKFIPHPSTWFNQGRYDDDPEVWKRDYSRPDQRQSGIWTPTDTF